MGLEISGRRSKQYGRSGEGVDAATAYRTAAKKAPNLLTAIQKIERDALKAMQTEGYGFNQLHTALQESRFRSLWRIGMQ